VKNVLKSPPVVSHSKIGLVAGICKQAFADFDEIWLVGHKGDHHFNLVRMGVLPSYNQSIGLAQVHSTLGLSTALLTPPETSSRSIEAMTNELNGGFNDHIRRVRKLGLRVCVLMPFPNAGLSRMIASCDAQENFVLTAPAKSRQEYLDIENKTKTAELVHELIVHGLIGDHLLIPWMKGHDPNGSFAFYAKRLGLVPKQGLYFQKDVSVSGAGTTCVRSQQDLDELMKYSSWRRMIRASKVKISAEVPNAYPANGSACVIPVGGGKCVVLIDPLSRKAMGPQHSSYANDWTVPWSADVRSQYIRATTALGEMLFKKFGYTGIFGPDYLVTTQDGKQILRLTEINPRWQGTTPYQTASALRTGRIPLELVHYIVKLDEDGGLISRLLQIIGDTDEFNKVGVLSGGGFYIKLAGPSELTTIANDANGAYLYTGDRLIGPYASDTDAHHVGGNMVSIKAPRAGEHVKKGLVPIGYVAGVGREPVLLSDSPRLSPYGERLRLLANNLIFEEQS
jgi:hypothetical protein